jgi:hypothetical protein
MRKIEERIIKAINKGETARLSIRDAVETFLPGEKGAPELTCRVTLHYTPIAIVYADRVIINTGGWRTNTTKSRLNAILWEYCATHIYQHDFTWYLLGSDDALNRADSVDVIDGMSIPRRNKRWNGDAWEVSDVELTAMHY